jgi:hypothetical protein
MKITNLKSWCFLLVIAFSWYSKPMGNFEESSEKIIKTLKDNRELDKKNWSQETIDQLNTAVKSPNMTDFLILTIAIGDAEGAKTFLASVADDYNPLVGCRADNIRALRFATAQGHFEIVKLLTSKDEWLKPEEAQRNLKEALGVAENMIVRIQKMLEQPKLTDETRKLYQERKENYQAIRARLRATLILPLETLRVYDENHLRAAAYSLPNELLYLIGFFLFDAWTYTNLFAKSKY